MERWRFIQNTHGAYLVSDLGRIKKARSGLILKPKANRYGYLEVRLTVDGKRHCLTVHRLVLEAFVGLRPEGQQCRHLDGNPENNALANLVWGTPEENYDDRRRHGTDNSGERHAHAKLTEAKVRAIRASSASVARLAREFKVSKRTVLRIRSGEGWADLDT